MYVQYWGALRYFLLQSVVLGILAIISSICKMLQNGIPSENSCCLIFLFLNKKMISYSYSQRVWAKRNQLTQKKKCQLSRLPIVTFWHWSFSLTMEIEPSRLYHLDPDHTLKSCWHIQQGAEDRVNGKAPNEVSWKDPQKITQLYKKHRFWKKKSFYFALEPECY